MLRFNNALISHLLRVFWNRPIPERRTKVPVQPASRSTQPEADENDLPWELREEVD
jgi:hypothetical protein